MKLSETVIIQLRSKGILGPNETAEREGGLVIARDVITQARRVLDESQMAGVAVPQLLKD